MQAMSGSDVLEPVRVTARDAGNEWIVDAATQQAMDAIRSIMEADEVDLMRLDRESGMIDVAAPGPGAGIRLPRVVRESITARMDPVTFDHQIYWVEEQPGAQGATLLARIVQRDSHVYFIAARVRNTPDKRAHASRLMPDLARLVVLHLDAGVRQRGLAQEQDAAMQVLDHGECGVVVIRSDLSIVLTNTAARAALEAEAGLHIRRGMVRPTSYADAIRFQEAVNRVIDPPSSERSLPPRAIVMLLSGGLEARPPVLAIVPTERRAHALDGAAAVIYLVQPATGTFRGFETLCRIHGLSKVETRLMVHMSTGLAVTDAAAEMRIKVETARSYLKQIFGKVGVKRQADLMILMARYQRALRGNFNFQAA